MSFLIQRVLGIFLLKQKQEILDESHLVKDICVTILPTVFSRVRIMLEKIEPWTFFCIHRQVQYTLAHMLKTSLSLSLSLDHMLK